jgi:hypothetical protein
LRYFASTQACPHGQAALLLYHHGDIGILSVKVFIWLLSIPGRKSASNSNFDPSNQISIAIFGLARSFFEKNVHHSWNSISDNFRLNAFVCMNVKAIIRRDVGCLSGITDK